MEGHRANPHAAIRGLPGLKSFAHFESTGLEIGPGKDLVVGDDM